MGNPFEDSGDDEEGLLDTVDTGYLPGEEPTEMSLEAEEELPQSREEKKRNRYQEQYDGRIQAEARAQALTEELARANQRPVPQLSPAAPQESPYAKKLDDIHEARTALFDKYNTKRANSALTPEEEKEFSSKARQLEIEQQKTVVMQVNAENRAPAPNPQDLAIQARHADVMSNPRAHAWATANYQQKMAEGIAPSMEVMDDAMDGARKQFDMGAGAFSRSVDPSRQARYRGDSTGRGAPPSDEPRKIRMNSDLKGMADSLYSHIPDERERHKKWAREVGPGFLEAERKAGRR